MAKRQIGPNERFNEGRHRYSNVMGAINNLQEEVPPGGNKPSEPIICRPDNQGCGREVPPHLARTGQTLCVYHQSESDARLVRFTMNRLTVSAFA